MRPYPLGATPVRVDVDYRAQGPSCFAIQTKGGGGGAGGCVEVVVCSSASQGVVVPVASCVRVSLSVTVGLGTIQGMYAGPFDVLVQQ